MKKTMIGIITGILIIGLIFQLFEIKQLNYTDDAPLTIELNQKEVKILQITDLHMFMGFDYQDRKTLNLIKELALSDDYDLIVISGDLSMSPFAPLMIRKLAIHMESLKIPWTFIFGNHETDFNSYASILNRLPKTEYLYFKVGPKIKDGGVGNFKINFTYNNQIFYHAYFLDSKSERTNYTEAEGRYDYLSESQVAWYESHVKNDIQDSIVFMHMPLRQFIDPETYIGIFNEKQVYAQGKDTGFFDMMLQYQKSKAVFVGHDHLNDFYTIVDGIYLVYGRVTGYNAYGNLERGGRIILIDEDLTLSTELILESEVIS